MQAQTITPTTLHPKITPDVIAGIIQGYFESRQGSGCKFPGDDPSDARVLVVRSTLASGAGITGLRDSWLKHVCLGVWPQNGNLLDGPEIEVAQRTLLKGSELSHEELLLASAQRKQPGTIDLADRTSSDFRKQIGFLVVVSGCASTAERDAICRGIGSALEHEMLILLGRKTPPPTRVPSG